MDPIVTVEDVSVGFGEHVLLEHVSFEVSRGEVFAILGGSGAGKSTLLRLMVGLAPPLAGRIDVAGRGAPDLDLGLPPFGVMFQGGALFGSMSVGENVGLALAEWTALPADAIRAVVRAKLRLVGLEEAVDKLPSELSGGMKKRAAIARALALDPELVFLDEPSAGLDPVTSADLDRLVVTLNRTLGLSVVLVTHELESVFDVADRCVLLDGETRGILAAGDPRELRSSAEERVSAFFQRRTHP